LVWGPEFLRTYRKLEVVLMNYIAILVAAVAAFVASSVYYVIFGKALTALLPAESVAVDMQIPQRSSRLRMGSYSACPF
jgi:hypothetical protein